MATTDKNEYMFFDKGLGLVIANLDYALDSLDDLKSKYVNDLEKITEEYDAVEDFAKYREINKELINLIDTLNKEEALKDNKELFVTLNEPVFINKYIEKLLDSNDDKDINEEQVLNYLQDNFSSTIKKILDFKNIKNVLDDQMTKVLKVLVDEHEQDDIDQGLGIVLAFLIKEDKENTGDFETVLSLVTEADAIASYIYFLNQED